MNLQGPQKGTIRSGQTDAVWFRELRAVSHLSCLHERRPAPHFLHDPRSIFFMLVARLCGCEGSHCANTLTVSWSADGQRLATACFDGTSCVWERQGQGGRGAAGRTCFTCFHSDVQLMRSRAKQSSVPPSHLNANQSMTALPHSRDTRMKSKTVASAPAATLSPRAAAIRPSGSGNVGASGLGLGRTQTRHINPPFPPLSHPPSPHFTPCNADYDDDDEEYDCCANLCDHTQDVKTAKWHPTREVRTRSRSHHTGVCYPAGSVIVLLCANTCTRLLDSGKWRL
jgi:hypothetical protein